jgi:C4-dicarboxylate transporter DctM subunit
MVILLMFLLVALGVPVTFSLGLASLWFFIQNNVPMVSFAQKFVVATDSFSLISLPFFILAGNLMNTGGVTRRLFDFCDSLFGHIRGGLCYVTVVSSTIFSAISGSALANAAGLGAMQIKAMTDRGYPKEFTTSLVTTASVLGPIIPPSILMIIYGVTAGVSIQRQFVGGIIPGLIYAGFCCIYSFYYAKKFNLAVGEKFSFKRAVHEFGQAIWALLAPAIILVGILTGVFTATESGAVACVYVVIVAMFVYKELTIKQLVKCLLDSAKTTGTILLIAATASVLGFCLTYSKLPQRLAASMTSSIHSTVVMMLIFTLIYLFLGTMMEGAAIILTTVPIFVGICNQMNIDLVYFGVFISVLLSIATVTPPVGTVMFVICKNNGMTIGQYTKNMLPWFGLMVIVCVLIAIFPALTTFLPNLLYN